MSGNVLGRYLRVTTFGESHGPALGAVLDGLPPRLAVALQAVQRELDRRRPGGSTVGSAREESDTVEVLAGLFEGQTTGAPLCLVIANRDARPEDYASLRQLFRPGHADLTYHDKYGIRDWRGGGRASGRETAARVAAGAVARQLLAPLGVRVLGHVVQLAGIQAAATDPTAAEQSPVRCGDPVAAERMQAAVEQARQDGDSVGGVVEVIASGVPAGWGDPVFCKLDALLAGALMSIGAVKGVEVGDGFALARLRGSQANDAMEPPRRLATNHAGGVLGGISTGQDLVLRCAVKPTPSIRHPQQTVDLAGRPTTLSVDGRHDPCIAPRLVPVAEAMTCLVLADAWLAQRALGG